MMFTITFEILGEKFRIRNVKATNEFKARKIMNEYISGLRQKNGGFVVFGKKLIGTPAELKSGYNIIKVEEQKIETPDFTQTLKDFLGL